MAIGLVPKTIVCFAVKEEAAAFEQLASSPSVNVILTGIGQRNAQRTVGEALVKGKPKLLLTCGFAGSLRTDWESGTVVFEAEPGSDLEGALLAAGAVRGRFHCAQKVATTTREKRLLRDKTGMDAVEMESQIIRALAREHGIPSATIRVILDTAEQDLPLDFNLLMNRNDKIDAGKLTLALLKAPNKIGRLLALQKQSRSAAEKLARVLAAITLGQSYDKL